MRTSELAWFYTRHLLPQEFHFIGLVKSLPSALMICHIVFRDLSTSCDLFLLVSSFFIWVLESLLGCDHVVGLYILLDKDAQCH